MSLNRLEKVYRELQDCFPMPPFSPALPIVLRALAIQVRDRKNERNRALAKRRRSKRRDQAQFARRQRRQRRVS